MEANPKNVAVFLFSCLFLCASAAAQEKHMQLVGPDTGWFLAGNNLLWTEDNGQHWTDVTPPMSLPGEEIADVYFKDPNDGWVLLSADENDGPEARFEVASTVNSGAGWSVSPVEVPGLNWRQTILYGQGRVYFLDSRRGWLQLDEQSGSAFRGALLLATHDAGITWVVEPSSGTGGRFCFVDAHDGWVAGGPTGGELYATRDGGSTWQEISVKAPRETGPATVPIYDIPVFRDPKHGFLPVTYRAPEEGPSALVLFATQDGGRTWKPHRVMTGLEGHGDLPFPSAVVDSAWLTARSDPSSLTIRMARLSPGSGGVESRTAAIQRQRLPTGSLVPVLEMSFITNEQGWVRTDRLLLATPDGGAAWRDITPWPAVMERR